jgi:hypothetical protein
MARLLVYRWALDLHESDDAKKDSIPADSLWTLEIQICLDVAIHWKIKDRRDTNTTLFFFSIQLYSSIIGVYLLSCFMPTTRFCRLLLYFSILANGIFQYRLQGFHFSPLSSYLQRPSTLAGCIIVVLLTEDQEVYNMYIDPPLTTVLPCYMLDSISCIVLIRLNILSLLQWSS